jgi:hypothetical protein
MKKYIQRGENPEWPLILEGLWKYGETIPEWLSDRANVTILSGDGIKNIEVRETSSGGYEIIDSGKSNVLVSVKKKDWFVIYDGKIVKSISPEQLLFLYKEKFEKA